MEQHETHQAGQAAAGKRGRQPSRVPTRTNADSHTAHSLSMAPGTILACLKKKT